MNCMVKAVQIGNSNIGPEKFVCAHGYCLSEFGAASCPHGDASTMPLFGCVLCRGEIKIDENAGIHVLPEEFATWATMVQELSAEHDSAPKSLGDAIAQLIKKEPRIQGEQILVQTILGAMIEGIEAIEAGTKKSPEGRKAAAELRK